MSTKSDRRPRLASSCQDLRQCERWRGEILREVSRKVSKIQDAGLTDYEVRDLNDEINKLLREKGHWENQIINLGGANYRRVGSSTFDGAGRSAPGQRGYKYFGRAKELPGVKELFEGLLFGDLDEYGAEGEQLLKYESAHERQDWEDTFESISALLSIPSSESVIPPFPTATNEVDLTSRVTAEPEGQLSAIRDKRKADSDPPGTPSKKKSSNLDESGVPPDQQDTQAMPNSADPSDQSEKTTVPPKPPLSIFDPADLQPPPVPTIEQWGQLIMQLQKAALLKEYIG
ncbi:hypothetical protein H4Q26_015917 [Puccinia striiformis f. sp. tritici PST-130]|nr:hypothetical protein H4Q26_015917 [Puccinia striiformis f. sp. tritici PST-130]